MKSVGEAMAMGRTFQESFQKARHCFDLLSWLAHSGGFAYVLLVHASTL